MPQATDELRAKMVARFGTIGDDGPWEFLKSRGYTMDHFYISIPSPLRKITEDEGDCIDFLCDEWDWAFENVTAV